MTKEQEVLKEMESAVYKRETRLYRIYDIIAEESGPVFEANNDSVAWRRYNQTIRDVEDPSEWELHCIGIIVHLGHSPNEYEIIDSFHEVTLSQQEEIVENVKK